MTSIDDWEFNCSKCGALLHIYAIFPNNKRVSFIPCIVCTNEKYLEGLDNGEKIVNEAKKNLNV